MENLQQATEKICDLKGNVMALEAIIDSLLQSMTPEFRQTVLTNLCEAKEVAQSQLLGAVVSEQTVTAFERDVQRVLTRWHHS